MDVPLARTLAPFAGATNESHIQVESMLCAIGHAVDGRARIRTKRSEELNEQRNVVGLGVRTDDAHKLADGTVEGLL
jgi:hypothetical protein